MIQAPLITHTRWQATVVIVRRHDSHCSQLPISDAWGRCLLPSSCRLTTALQELDIHKSYTMASIVKHSDTSSSVSLRIATLEAENANMCAVIDDLMINEAALKQELAASKSREAFLEVKVALQVSAAGWGGGGGWTSLAISRCARMCRLCVRERCSQVTASAHLRVLWVTTTARVRPTLTPVRLTQPFTCCCPAPSLTIAAAAGRRPEVGARGLCPGM